MKRILATYDKQTGELYVLVDGKRVYGVEEVHLTQDGPTLVKADDSAPAQPGRAAASEAKTASDIAKFLQRG